MASPLLSVALLPAVLLGLLCSPAVALDHKAVSKSTGGQLLRHDRQLGTEAGAHKRYDLEDGYDIGPDDDESDFSSKQGRDSEHQDALLQEDTDFANEEEKVFTECNPTCLMTCIDTSHGEQQANPQGTPCRWASSGSDNMGQDCFMKC
mmetsp:Transcript_82047/g.213706  ORF Transcript_82047/g.213706 Transcript_82047/m.213706 type:complete len:149 (+) Transcript_82047:107-553(+)